MSSGYSDDTSVDSMTSRGRDWPCLRQFVVFLENKVGSLHTLLRKVERDDLKVMAMSILDSSDSAIARLITNDYERTLELLALSGMPFSECEVIGVLLPDVDQPHSNICGGIMTAELNVHYLYPLMYRRDRRGAVALYVDNVDEALRVLKEQHHDFVTEDDLMEYDDMFD